MNKPEPTKRDIESQNKKHTIFQVSMSLFKEYGYNNVTMKMIAKESGISEGSIYHFFGEKAGILFMLSREVQQEISPLIEPTDEHLKNPRNTLLEYLTAQAAEYEKLGRDLAAIHHLALQKAQAIKYDKGRDLISTINHIEPNLTCFIQKAIDRGTIDLKISAEEFAYTLVTIGSGLTTIWTIYGDGYSLVESSQRVFSSALDAYFGFDK